MAKQRWIVKCHNDDKSLQYVSGDVEFTPDRSQAKKFRTYRAACREANCWYAAAGVSFSEVIEVTA